MNGISCCIVFNEGFNNGDGINEDNTDAGIDEFNMNIIYDDH